MNEEHTHDKEHDMSKRARSPHASRYRHDDPSTYAAFDDETAFATGDETNEVRPPPHVDRDVSDEQDAALRPQQYAQHAGAGVGRVLDPPTPKQVEYLRSLLVRMAELCDVDDGIDAARERYGREIGRCGICNRTLTDEESRRIGIGPVCRKNT